MLCAYGMPLRVNISIGSPGIRDAVMRLAFSPDGTTLASGGGYKDKRVRLWDVVTGEREGTLTGHKGAVMGLAFSPDGHDACQRE